MMTISLNSVSSITATLETGVFILHCNITDLNGETYNTDYCSRPSDTFGLNPVVRQWLVDNPAFPIQPYTPPTPEKIRASLPNLTARQLRLGLVNGGFTLSQVQSVIDSMPEGAAKETAKIEWEYATTFNRTHPLIATVGAALGLSDEQIDAMWMAAVDL